MRCLPFGVRVEFGELSPSEELEVTFVESAGRLAQLPGTSFYRRIRDKFGHLAV
jgi:NAD+ kinase